jgi:exo-1,4-beta-D-glucosaminidase
MMFVLVTQASANIMTLTEGWQVRLSETDNWIPATVPSTLMGVLTANGIEPETVPASCWYRTTFNLSALKKGEHAILNFDGISYRANVWLNGQQIANSQQMFGTFRQFEFDVTKQRQGGIHDPPHSQGCQWRVDLPRILVGQLPDFGTWREAYRRVQTTRIT